MKKLLLQIVLFLCSYFSIAQKTLFIPTEWSDPNNEFYNRTSNARKYESTNFVLYWGDKVGTNPSVYSDADLRFTPQSVADTLETSFKRYITDLHFVNNAPTTNLGKYKIIIMMMNTWNSTDDRLTAFAHASSFSNTIGAMFVHPQATRDGGALSHEFAHTLQMMMRIQENPGNGTAFAGYDWAGPFFEGHANFMRAQAYPQWAEIDGTLTRWIQTRHFMWSSNRHHYTNFHLMYYVQEKDGFDFTRRMWAESINQEHPLETIKRLKGLTQEQLNDYLWGYAQRQPAFDYPIQWNSQINTASNFGKKIRETHKFIQNNMPRYTSRQYTLLTKVAGTTDQYYTNNDWAPQDYGMNVIPLHPTCTGTQKKVTIKFKGHTEVNNTQAGWRYGFVTTKADGTISRYSPMYNSDGEASFTLNTGSETGIFLVVFAAPKVHVNYNMDVGYPKQRRYPYEVKIANANPEGFQSAADFRSFLKTNGHLHSNGGGWVSNNATVAASVYVGPYAVVRAGTVSGNARIEDYGMVDGGTINGNAIVRGNACVYNATLSNSAIVEGNAWMEGGSVSSTANIKGNAMLFAGNFGSSVVVGGDAEIGSCSTPGVYLQFPYWRNGRTDCDGKGATDVSNVDINAAFTNFTAAQMAFATTPACTTGSYTLSTSVTPTGAGSVSPSSGSYDSGTAVTLTATPTTGYQFVNWTSGATVLGTNSSLNLTMTTNQSITANFSLIQSGGSTTRIEFENLPAVSGYSNLSNGVSGVPSSQFSAGNGKYSGGNSLRGSTTVFNGLTGNYNIKVPWYDKSTAYSGTFRLVIKAGTTVKLDQSWNCNATSVGWFMKTFSNVSVANGDTIEIYATRINSADPCILDYIEFGPNTAKRNNTAEVVLNYDIDLTVYPNPTKGNLNISFGQTQKEKVTILLFDLNGKKLDVVTEKIYEAGKVDIQYNCQNLPQGVYLLKIQIGNDIVNKSFIKQ